ncbi:MAG: prenyltransferase [Verrucomicrobiota bacterium]
MTRTQSWIHAIRLYSFTTTLLPMLMGFAFCPQWDWVLATLIILSVFVTHAGTNMINDYYDYIYGVDQIHTRGSSRVLVNKQLSPLAVRNVSWGCFVVGALAGLAVVFYTRRYELLLFGIFAVLTCFFYSSTKFQLKRRGLGDIGVLICTGPLITVGIYYAQTGQWDPWVCVAGLIPGLLAVDVLHTNNLRDVASDKIAGLWNIAHSRWGVAYWWMILALAYGVQIVLIWNQKLSVYTLLTLLLPLIIHPRVSIEKMALGHLLFNSIVVFFLFFDKIFA